MIYGKIEECSRACLQWGRSAKITDNGIRGFVALSKLQKVGPTRRAATSTCWKARCSKAELRKGLQVGWRP